MPTEDDRPKWLLDYFQGVYEVRYYSVILDGKKYAIVKKDGHMAWTHNYAPWHYEPTTYELLTKFTTWGRDPKRKELGTGRLTKEMKAKFARILKQADRKRRTG
jgi:hypothetical protein